MLYACGGLSGPLVSCIDKYRTFLVANTISWMISISSTVGCIELSMALSFRSLAKAGTPTRRPWRLTNATSGSRARPRPPPRRRRTRRIGRSRRSKPRTGRRRLKRNRPKWKGNDSDNPIQKYRYHYRYRNRKSALEQKNSRLNCEESEKSSLAVDHILSSLRFVTPRNSSRSNFYKPVLKPNLPSQLGRRISSDHYRPHPSC